MIRPKTSMTLFAIPVLLFLSAISAHAWSFMPNTLVSPYNQCLTCHVSNADLAMNPYGQDYLDPSFATKYHNKHKTDPGNDCNVCHAGKGYPVKRSGLDNLDSDGDTFTNLMEFSAGTFPGDPSDYPVDATAPVITAFSVPATFNTLTVAITSFSASDNMAVTGYMLTESGVAPAAGDPGWSATAPTYYTFAVADIATLYAWAKDAAGNVSTPGSAQVDTTSSQQRVNQPPVAFAGNDQVVTEGQTVTLDGSGSTDDLGIIAYSWVQLDGPGGSPIAAGHVDAVVLSDAGSVTPSFVAPAVGINGTTLTFELTVTDGDAAQSVDEVYVTVEDTIDTIAPVITAFSAPATSNTLTVAITSFTASDNVAVTGYMLTQSSVAPAAGDPGWSATAPSFYTFAVADIATLYAWAKDAAGNVSTPGSAQVDTTSSQQHVNQPPVAFAGNDQVVTEGQTVTLDGSGSTDDLGIIAYSWVQLNGPGGSPIAAGHADRVVLSNSNSMTPSFVTPAVGVNGTTLTFELTVTDGDAAQDISETSIIINDNGISTFDGMQGVISTLTSDGYAIGVNAGGANACTYLSTLRLQDMPQSSSQPLSLLYGLVDFELKVTDSANSYVIIHFPSAIPAGYKWYKYTSAKGWFDFDRDLISGGTGEGAVFSPDRTQVTIYISDNSVNDDDPAAGIIRDPGGLTTSSISTPTSSTTSGANSFGGSSGGCFLTAIRLPAGLDWPVPVLPGVLLLIGIIGVGMAKQKGRI